MNDNVRDWIAALRSGEYKQTTQRLRVNNNFFCLGVAYELAVKKGIIDPARSVIVGHRYYNYQGEISKLPKQVMH